MIEAIVVEHSRWESILVKALSHYDIIMYSSPWRVAAPALVGGGFGGRASLNRKPSKIIPDCSPVSHTSRMVYTEISVVVVSQLLEPAAALRYLACLVAAVRLGSAPVTTSPGCWAPLVQAINRRDSWYYFPYPKSFTRPNGRTIIVLPSRVVTRLHAPGNHELLNRIICESLKSIPFLTLEITGM